MSAINMKHLVVAAPFVCAVNDVRRERGLKSLNRREVNGVLRELVRVLDSVWFCTDCLTDTVLEICTQPEITTEEIERVAVDAIGSKTFDDRYEFWK